MRTIPLYRHGEIVAHAKVDDEDFEWLNECRWKLSPYGYAIRRASFKHDGVRDNRLLFMHREVLGLTFRDGKHTDHINGDPLDNRRANLRVMSVAEHAASHAAERRGRKGRNEAAQLSQSLIRPRQFKPDIRLDTTNGAPKDAARLRLPEPTVQAQPERRNGRLHTETLELWASAEVCESLKWTRRHLQLAREGGTFPEPVAVVAAGRIAVWDAKAVRGWAVENMVKERQQWFRHSEAVRMFRRGDSIHEIARQLGAKRDSVRKWLRDAGELPTAETQAL